MRKKGLNIPQTVPTKAPSPSTPVGLIMKPAQELASCMIAVPKILSRMPMKMCVVLRSRMIQKPTARGRIYRRNMNQRVSTRISGPMKPIMNARPQAAMIRARPLKTNCAGLEKRPPPFNQCQPGINRQQTCRDK